MFLKTGITLLFFLLINTSVFAQNNKISVIDFKQANNSECEPHSLIIHTIPEGADVYVDSLYYGISPLEIKDINVLHIDITLKKNEIKQTHTIYNFHKTNELFFILDTTYGLLNINTRPDSVKTYLNDSLIGYTPIKDFKIKTGIAKIILTKDDYNDISNSFNIKSLKYDLNFNMYCKFGYLTFGGIENRTIKIDSAEYGNKRDYKLKLPVGSHLFEASPPDFHRIIKNELNVNSEKSYTLNFEYNYFTLEYFSKSILIPGLGQFCDGSKTKGISFFAASLLSGALLLKSHFDYKSQADEVKKYRTLYNDANNESDALKYRNLLKSSDERLSSLQDTKKIYISAFVGIYISNLLDAIIFHHRGGSFTLEKRNPDSTAFIDTINLSIPF